MGGRKPAAAPIHWRGLALLARLESTNLATRLLRARQGHRFYHEGYT